MPGSVTLWLGQLKDGDRVALRELWQRYFSRLVGQARAKLRSSPRRAVDEEDVALSAFDSLWHGVEQGRFPQLEDRDDLWQVLMLITARKAINQIKHEARKKRGEGKVRTASTLANDESEGAFFADLISKEPDPAMIAQLIEYRQRLLDALTDEQVRQVAIWKMEGYTNAEIAGKQGCVERTIERRLRIIRQVWEKTQEDDS